MRVHSSAICRAVRFGFQASRPEAYQFDCEKWCPHQLRSSPGLTTEATPVTRYGWISPSTDFATVDPLPLAKVSACRNSSHIVPR